MKKLNISNPINELNYAYSRHDIGLATLFAGGYVGAIILFFCLGMAALFHGILKKPVEKMTWFFIVVFVITLVINEIFLFHKNKYLKYFKEFDKMQGKERRKWKWISIIVVFGSLIFVICSFIFMDYRLNS